MNIDAVYDGLLLSIIMKMEAIPDKKKALQTLYNMR